MALRENKLSFFSWQLQSCGCADQSNESSPVPGKILKEYGSFSPLRSCMKKSGAGGSGKHLCDGYATETHYRSKSWLYLFQEVQNAQALMGISRQKQQ